MHRFVETWTIGRAAHCDLVIDEPGIADLHARLALRADGGIWLLSDAERPWRVDRGRGWAPATRLCLCAGDRIRLAARELSLAELCGLIGIEPDQAVAGDAIASDVPGMPTPVPLRVCQGTMEKARRDPATGQIEPSGEEHE